MLRYFCCSGIGLSVEVDPVKRKLLLPLAATEVAVDFLVVAQIKAQAHRKNRIGVILNCFQDSGFSIHFGVVGSGKINKTSFTVLLSFSSSFLFLSLFSFS